MKHPGCALILAFLLALALWLVVRDWRLIATYILGHAVWHLIQTGFARYAEWDRRMFGGTLE